MTTSGGQIRRAVASTPLLVRLLGAALVLLFVLSPMVLTRFGVHYETPGGLPLEKIHPAHFLIVFTFILVLFSVQRPLGYLDTLFMRHKGTFVFFITWVLLLFHITLVLRQPFTPIIDTFVLPMLLLFLISGLSAQDKRGLANLFHILMLANAALGLFEFATGFRLTPITAGGVVIASEWRSSALLGHPLANAMITGGYLLLLALGGARHLSSRVQILLFATSLLAMNAFGGRMALVALIVFLTPLALMKLAPVLHGKALSRQSWIFAASALPLLLSAVVVALEIGLFDRFLSRFIDDNGSASARLIMFEIFRDLSALDILIGPDPAHLASLLRVQGLNFGIESFWIAFVLSYGLIVSVIFFAGFFAFLWDVVRASHMRAVWPVLYFLAVITTSVSLSAKGTDFGIIVAMILLLLPPRLRPSPKELTPC